MWIWGALRCVGVVQYAAVQHAWIWKLFQTHTPLLWYAADTGTGSSGVLEARMHPVCMATAGMWVVCPMHIKVYTQRI